MLHRFFASPAPPSTGSGISLGRRVGLRWLRTRALRVMPFTYVLDSDDDRDALDDAFAADALAEKKKGSANPDTDVETLKRIVNSKQEHLSTSYAFTQEEKDEWVKKIDVAFNYKAPPVTVAPDAQLLTVIQLATTRDGGVFTPLLYVHGGFPTLEGYSFVRAGHEPQDKVAGIVTMRRSDHWLLFVLASMLFATGGRGWDQDEDLRLLKTLPPTLEEVPGIKVLLQFERFMLFTTTQNIDCATLLEGLGYRCFLWDCHRGERVKNSLVEREHHFGAWPPLPANGEDFHRQAVDVAAKYRASFDADYCTDDPEQEALDLWTSLGGGAPSVPSSQETSEADVLRMFHSLGLSHS